ncbi:hypothetical protein [Chryseobacterium gallinarum]|uniref:Uncharacterized protein n=1 Tax=Chryseobacterium gallinarum TaxID=1324352 RepID=A0ABX6KU94_CHRGL|nr:hypothetical protein [Chryseobacterium gallinarum]QIY91833.1 hypothetical protein FOB44_14745 [Chryseobacterium gallinarum]
MIQIILMLLNLAFPNINVYTNNNADQDPNPTTVSVIAEVSDDTGGEDGIIPPPKK